jgi:group I intron endonuclease
VGITGIYEIYCKTNNKRYIGKTSDFRRRQDDHLRDLRRNTHYNPHLQHAFNLYGENSFVFKMVEFCELGQLNDREILLIKELNAHESLGGFNVSWGGDGFMAGLVVSEETKRKMSENHADFRGDKAPFWGRHHTDEAKEKVRLANTGSKKPYSESHRLNMIKNHPDYSGVNHPTFGTKRKNATSKYFGVSKFLYKNDICWKALITLNKRSVHIGIYKNELVAANAYNKYIIENGLPHPLNRFSAIDNINIMWYHMRVLVNKKYSALSRILFRQKGV